MGLVSWAASRREKGEGGKILMITYHPLLGRTHEDCGRPRHDLTSYDTRYYPHQHGPTSYTLETTHLRISYRQSRRTQLCCTER